MLMFIVDISAQSVQNNLNSYNNIIITSLSILRQNDDHIAVQRKAMKAV